MKDILVLIKVAELNIHQAKVFLDEVSKTDLAGFFSETKKLIESCFEIEKQIEQQKVSLLEDLLRLSLAAKITDLRNVGEKKLTFFIRDDLVIMVQSTNLNYNVGDFVRTIDKKPTPGHEPELGYLIYHDLCSMIISRVKDVLGSFPLEISAKIDEINKVFQYLKKVSAENKEK